MVPGEALSSVTPPRLATALLALAANVSLPATAPASELYTTIISQLRLVNQEDATSTFVLSLDNANRGLCAAPNTNRILYAVGGDTLGGTPLLERIDVEARTIESWVVPVPPGFDDVGLTDLAIDPTDPGVALVAATALHPGLQPVLMPVDLSSGQIVGPAVPLEFRVDTLTFGPGGVLYGFSSRIVPQESTLVTIDPSTGALTAVGEPADVGTTIMEGIAFRPEDGALFAVAGGTVDELVRIDVATGALESIVGPVQGLGLVFLTPDDTPPEIRILEPRKIGYAQAATLVLDYEVEDDGSGVASFTPLLDGMAMVGGHGLQDGQRIDLSTELSLGPHTFTIEAVDNDGHAGSESVDFFVAVDPGLPVPALPSPWLWLLLAALLAGIAAARAGGRPAARRASARSVR